MERESDLTALDRSSPFRRSVLVVDDERTNRELVEVYLQDVDCDVLHAAGGREALDAIRCHSVDLVLLDINMPDLDGLEVCALIKHAPATKLLPVVMVTGRSAMEDHVNALDAGADDFLVKPISRVELLARVRTLTRLDRLHRQVATEAAEAAAKVRARPLDAG